MFDVALNPEDLDDLPESVVPPPVADAPEVEPWLRIVYDGFFDLGRSGMGGSPPLREKVFWLDYYGFTRVEDRDFILKMWRKMGSVAADIESEKAKSKTKKHPGGGGRGVMGQGITR